MNNYVFPFHLIPKESKIVLYGAGQVGTCFYKQLKTTNYADIILWVDAKCDFYREKNYPVEKVAKIGEVKNFDFVVIAVERVDIAQEIDAVLRKIYRVEEEKIVHFPQCQFADMGLYKNYEDEVLSVREKIPLLKKLIRGDVNTYDNRSVYHRRFIRGELVDVKAVHNFSVRDLILAQYFQEDYTNYKFYDAAVRLLAIAETEGRNDVGMDLYYRMQLPSGFDWRSRFADLIRSVKEHGISTDEPLELDRSLAVMDGAHRLILAWHTNVEFIPAFVLDASINRGFDKDWLWGAGFSRKECEIITDTLQKFLEEVNYDFTGVIWPPAMDWADDIIADIGEYGDVTVTDYYDIKTDKGDFTHLFKALYHTDVLDVQGMDDKLRLIDNSLPSNTEVYRIRVFRLRLQNPMMGINPKNDMPQSRQIKRIKTAVRNRYSGRIKNYVYDVALHIADNYLQSKFCEKILNVDRDISEFFEDIKGIKYALVRISGGRQSSDFPKRFYLRSDIDILVGCMSDLQAISDIAKLFCDKKFKNLWISVTKEMGENYGKVIVWMRDFPMFAFDVSLSVYGLDEDFSKECVGHALEKDYKYLPIEDEVIIRILEIIHEPKKTWHLEFVKEHLDKLDIERLYRHLTIRRDIVDSFLSELYREQ